MNIACPHCSQQLEVDPAWSGHEVACPSCGGSLIVPPAAAPQPVAAPRTPSKAPDSNRHLREWKRRQRLARLLRLLIVLGLLAGGAWWFNNWRGDRPAGEALRHLVQYAFASAKRLLEPAPTPAPIPTPVPTPAPEATPAPEPSPQASPEPTPPPADPLAWLIGRPDRWPREVVLEESAEFPAVFEGKTVGTVKVPRGAVLGVQDITAQDVAVSFRGGRKRLPHAMTNLRTLAAEEMAKPEPTPALQVAAGPEVRKPAPSLPAPRPPATNQLGALVRRDKSGNLIGTTFRVWAPNAKSVDVIGTFNNWRPGRDAMRFDRESGVWSLDLSGAKPGDEYAYLINGTLERRDPRARRISPDSGKSVVYDTQAFDWGDTAGERPADKLEDLVIYQLHPGTFYDPDTFDDRPGTLRDAITKLDHLKELGVNCVLLMPVNEFSGNHSWGYNPSDLFAVENAYGGPDALKEFVKAAHARGISVHLDIVHNHYGPEGIDLLQFDGYGGGNNKAGIYFYEDDERAQTPWGPRPDFGRPQVRDFIADQVRMWFDEYKIDGLRWDSTANIRRFGGGAFENPDGDKLIDEISRMIRREYPSKISIAEDAVGDERFDSSWEYDFHHAGADRDLGVVPQLVKPPGETDAADIIRRIETDLGFRRVIYTENHDETGTLNGNRRLVSDADEADPQSLLARRKHALAAVITLTAPGIPLVFMGQELMEDKAFHDSNPLSWKRGDHSFHASELYRDLIRLRRNLDNRSAALRDTHVRPLSQTGQTGQLLAYRRFSPGRAQDQLVVVINFSDQEVRDYPLLFPTTGDWRLLINTDDRKYGKDFTGIATSIPRSDGSKTIAVTLAPLSAQIFGLSTLGPAAADDDETLRVQESGMKRWEETSATSEQTPASRTEDALSTEYTAEEATEMTTPATETFDSGGSPDDSGSAESSAAESGDF